MVHAIEDALNSHELIKVKFNEIKEKNRKLVLSAEIEKQTSCESAGMIGHTIIFFRAHPDPEKRKISLPSKKQ